MHVVEGALRVKDARCVSCAGAGAGRVRPQGGQGRAGNRRRTVEGARSARETAGFNGANEELKIFKANHYQNPIEIYSRLWLFFQTEALNMMAGVPCTKGIVP